MLSFLQDGQSDDKKINENPVGESSLPANQQEQEYFTVSDQSKNVRKTTCLLIILFSIGLISLWLMIKKSTPQTAMASDNEESQIESAITKLMGVKSEVFGRMDEIVKRFYQFSDVEQVNVGELSKNPFEHEDFLVKSKESPDFKIMEQHIKQQTKQIHLLSIMDVPGQRSSSLKRCCMIDDKILYVGDSIKGFKVCKINENSVQLEQSGVPITLKLSE